MCIVKQLIELARWIKPTSIYSIPSLQCTLLLIFFAVNFFLHRIKMHISVIVSECSVLDYFDNACPSLSQTIYFQGKNAQEMLYKRCCHFLQRYLFLICFNSYLTEQVSPTQQMFCLYRSKVKNCRYQRCCVKRIETGVERN